jgi:ribosomal RNA-processing protein 36
VAGEFKADKFQQNYNFLAEVHSNELNTLRDSLKRARKMLNNAPRHLRDGYEGEVQRLQLALKRAESAVNKDHMDKIQREALQKVSKNEKEKRKQGKGSWFLKKCQLFRFSSAVAPLMLIISADKRELITRARYDALAAEGGKRAVKKVIDKKQKKISQKEKRSRPFPKGDPADKESRKRSAGGEHDARKRRRVG